MSLEPVPKIRTFQVYQRYDIATLDPKNERAQYENGQRDGEDGKGKRGGRDHRGNKIDLVVEKSSGFEESDYYHIIYQC